MRLRLLYRPKVRRISPCVPGTPSGKEPSKQFLSARYVCESIQMENFRQFDANRRIVGIHFHDIRHMVPPFPHNRIR